jgi:SAM-dependent methyltransferase
MQQLTDYHNKIVQYYQATENAYKDAWDLDHSHAIHYGYRDEKARNFRASLLRMNEVMLEAAGISQTDHVLDAGCGIGGSSFFLATHVGSKVTGISLSERQVNCANDLAGKKGLDTLVNFQVADYCNTPFQNNSFDVVWGCESICYASDKELFIQEAFRLLKPGGRLVVADGFVTKFENNDHHYIRNWLNGWQVNYLESPSRFEDLMKKQGFENTSYRDISSHAIHSSRRLNRFYYLANAYLLWKSITFRNRATSMQKMNIRACRYQYLAMKKGLWQYGLTVGRKPF